MTGPLVQRVASAAALLGCAGAGYAFFRPMFAPSIDVEWFDGRHEVHGRTTFISPAEYANFSLQERVVHSVVIRNTVWSDSHRWLRLPALLPEYMVLEDNKLPSPLNVRAACRRYRIAHQGCLWRAMQRFREL